MKFYHFTSRQGLINITSERKILPVGDVPITVTGGFKAIWLTTNPEPGKQLWSFGVGYDKTAVRLELDMDVTTPGLAYWPNLAQQFHMEKSWYKILGTTGGNPDHWYVYTNIIPFSTCKVQIIQ